jgi:hypothetical protein
VRHGAAERQHGDDVDRRERAAVEAEVGRAVLAYIDLQRVRRARRERSRGGSPGGPSTVTSRIGRADRGSLRMTFIMPSFRSV